MSRHAKPHAGTDRAVRASTIAIHAVNLTGTAGVAALAPWPAKAFAAMFAASSLAVYCFDQADGLNGHAFDGFGERRTPKRRAPAKRRRKGGRP